MTQTSATAHTPQEVARRAPTTLKWRGRLDATCQSCRDVGLRCDIVVVFLVRENSGRLAAGLESQRTEVTSGRDGVF
jgi:hypothetical protein